ncbi:MAG: carbohydrate-binding family 9-like protein [Verrucomicrobia bacterium]|jgi:hypothetical protein|nr:carbohydrate-binding family 9-like protein [Verrucomicrobiota bacterium]
MRQYHIQPAPAPSTSPICNWADPFWTPASTGEIAVHRPEGSNHQPRTRFKLLHSPDGLHGIFIVQDQFVRCVRTGYFSDVWKDSCVEFFVEPKPGAGYLNFEFSCGGSFLISHITDPERTPEGFKAFTKLPWDLGRQLVVASTLPALVDPEVPEPLEWQLAFYLPFSLLTARVGPLNIQPGAIWRGNLYKCGDETSHPHWVSWNEVDELNFHKPGCFGTLLFA